MATYVISDIHGRRDLFYKLLKEIDFKDGDTLYILGDVIDRGNEGVLLLDEISEMNNVILLKGNHEDLCYKSMTGDMDCFNCWIANGGMITHGQLMNLDKEHRYKLLAYINDLPLYKIVEVNNIEFVLVHAGMVNYSGKSVYDMLKYQTHNLLWARGLFLEGEIDYDGYIVFGHTITATIPWELKGEIPDGTNVKDTISKSRIWKSDNKIGIDCGAVSGGSLSCLRLDDFEEFYIQ